MDFRRNANAYLADISSNENRSKMDISSNLGFIVGAASAALLGSTIFGNIRVLIGSIILGDNFILLVSNEAVTV